MKSNKKILELIDKNASVNEICNITGLSHKQLFYRMNMLKIKGYDFIKKYYYDGEIVYDLTKNLSKENEKENEVTIITSKKDKNFKAILLSDLHFSNIYEIQDILYKVYDMCIKDNINIIINTGDLIDGPEGCGNSYDKITLSIEKQIERMLNNYPFDKNILNFICLGNHDLYCLKTDGINLKNILENKRHDLVPIGFGYGTINVKNDKIYVNHPINGVVEPNAAQRQNQIILSGHSHMYKHIVGGNDHHIYLPSLSNLVLSNSDGIHKEIPSMLKFNMDFINGVFNVLELEQLIYINNNFYKVSESKFEIKGRNTNLETVNNEEERKKYNESKNEKIKVLKSENNRLSRIEKFNKRYKLNN